MKYKLVLVVAVLMAGLAALFVAKNYPRIDSNFATRVFLKYHYDSKSIDIEIKNRKDVSTLKELLVGRSYKDHPACGFDVNVSITLTDGHKNITFCPACDCCPKLRIGKTDRYISISREQRKLLETILAKYGMTFPCV